MISVVVGDAFLRCNPGREVELRQVMIRSMASAGPEPCGVAQGQTLGQVPGVQGQVLQGPVRMKACAEVPA